MPQLAVELDIVQATTRASLVYLAEYSPTGDLPFGLGFLHRVRHPKFLANHPCYGSGVDAAGYYASLPDAMEALVRELSDVRPEIVLTPPSSRHDADPYLAAIKARRDYELDLTPYFGRTGSLRAGQLKDDASFIPLLGFSHPGQLAQYSSVLMVDDVYSKGKTAAAVLYWLRERGLPDSADFTVAVPLVVPHEAK